MIRVRNLVKNYGDFAAVKDISFDVGQGEIFAFLGPNGAGKTTTIKILTTLLKPTSGQVELDGLNPAVEHNEARKRFGIVFQDPSLDEELTAYENMDFHGVLYKVPGKLRAERIEKLLRLFELWDRRNDFVKQFSGGMKREQTGADTLENAFLKLTGSTIRAEEAGSIDQMRNMARMFRGKRS
jgi:ABC-2 type transport system ATP-binding protein